MHTQRSSTLARTYLLVVAVFTMAACDRSGSPLAPPDRGPEGTVVRDGGRPATLRGTPLTREQARQKRIVHARTALAHARSGATVHLSDGRELSGADAILYLERTLHALESGSSPPPVLSVADSSDGITSMSAESDAGYVYGETVLHTSTSTAWVWAWTDGKDADLVRVSGGMQVGLMSTIGGVWHTEYLGYGQMAYGDEVSDSEDFGWDNRWQMQYTQADSEHDAVYGTFTAWTVSSASR